MSSVDVAPPAAWSESEKLLWEAFTLGKVVELSGFDPTSNAGAKWELSQTISADALAHMLLHPPDAQPGHSARLLLSGARITGKLDVGCGQLAPFLLSRCIFDETPFFNDAHASFVGLVSCAIPGILANRLNCTGPLWLQNSHFSQPVDLVQSSIEGELNLRQAHLQSLTAKGAALILDGVEIGGTVDLSHVVARGGISFAIAHIGGNLKIGGAQLENEGANSIVGIRAQIDGSFYAPHKLHSTGGVNLEGIKIDGSLSMLDSEITHPKGVALHLDHAEIALGVMLDGTEIAGMTRIHHARIGCQLGLKGAVLDGRGRVALSADHIVVDGSILFIGKFRAIGKIYLHGAEVECTVNMNEAQFENSSDWAIVLDDSNLGGDLLAHNCTIKSGIQATGAVIGGSVHLADSDIFREDKVAAAFGQARISGSLYAANCRIIGGLSISDAQIGSSVNISDITVSRPKGLAFSGAALILGNDFIANRATVDGVCDLTAAKINGSVRMANSEITGVPKHESSLGASIDQRRGGSWRGLSFRCSGAEIQGDLDLRGSSLTRELSVSFSTVTRRLLLDDATLHGKDGISLSATGLKSGALHLLFRDKPSGSINLEQADVGVLCDNENTWPEQAEVQVGSFTYEAIDSSLDLTQRLAWLKHATPSFSPQPYTQLAMHYTSVGSDDEARKVYLDAERRSYRSGKPQVKIWGAIQDGVIGFGYAPLRPLIILVLVWVSASLWFVSVEPTCVRNGATSTGLCPVKFDEHPTWDPWLYTLDQLVPIIDLGHATAWDPTGWSKVVTYILMFGGWILTTTVVAAAARILRRN